VQDQAVVLEWNCVFVVEVFSSSRTAEVFCFFFNRNQELNTPLFDFDSSSVNPANLVSKSWRDFISLKKGSWKASAKDLVFANARSRRVRRTIHTTKAAKPFNDLESPPGIFPQ
jgi:hypothetical protein